MNARLHIWINGHEYVLQRMPSELADVRLAWQLDGMETEEPYVVTLSNHGQVSCECGDWQYRRQQRMQNCKHIAALIEVGLVPHKSKIWSKV